MDTATTGLVILVWGFLSILIPILIIGDLRKILTELKQIHNELGRNRDLQLLTRSIEERNMRS